VCLVTYVAGSIGCYYSSSIEVLLVCRVLQGIGQGCCALPSAIIRDSTDDPARCQALQSYMVVLKPISLMLAPAVGGLVVPWAGWRNMFLGFAIWASVTVSLIIILFPETKRHSQGLSTGAGAGAGEGEVEGGEEGSDNAKKGTDGGRSFMSLVAQIRPCLSHVHLLALTGRCW
jgi:MFS family permease